MNKGNMILLLTSILWGFAFVAQRAGMEHVGPFVFNGVRFALGSIWLIPVMLANQKRKWICDLPSTGRRTVLLGGGAAGVVLFIASSFQQIGIVYTTAGKAGFITGLNVIIVPILGLFWRQRSDISTWIGAFLAAVGLYLLSATGSFTISRGDLLVFVSAFFWAVHIHVIGCFSTKVDSIKLAVLQFSVCSALSLISAALTESIIIQKLFDASIPILYGGLVSVGIAYTLQVVAQRYAHPSHAAIILSLESVFAAIGGWLVLNEALSARGIVGCTLMLSGMILSQINLTKGSGEKIIML